MEPNKPVVTPKLNDARIKCFNGVPLRDIECVDAIADLWRGKRIQEPGTPADAMMDVYFTQRYNPSNDLDRMLPPIFHFTDLTILGVEFWVVPKDKLVFGYDAPSAVGLIKPALQFAKPSSMNF